jgi:hypothetical protein
MGDLVGELCQRQVGPRRHRRETFLPVGLCSLEHRRLLEHVFSDNIVAEGEFQFRQCLLGLMEELNELTDQDLETAEVANQQVVADMKTNAPRIAHGRAHLKPGPLMRRQNLMRHLLTNGFQARLRVRG